MIGLTPPDRWTCPTCHRTVVPQARSEARLLQALRTAQEQHAARHSSRLDRALQAALDETSNAGRVE